jgi:hypothetical protein
MRAASTSWGHAWSNYALVRATSQLLRWGGISRTASLVSSVVLANAFFTLVEVKDGYKPQDGFSWQDYQFNIIGEALGALLKLYPELDRRFDYHLDYFPSKYLLPEGVRQQRHKLRRGLQRAAPAHRLPPVIHRRLAARIRSRRRPSHVRLAGPKDNSSSSSGAARHAHTTLSGSNAADHMACRACGRARC